ncbi:hypothetical protein A3F28_01720 [Candidatus Uhrbacteria bacterium RIFCSPHIGHO2_12_FULL_57_11]|nr:MAG: hypothetical protein A3F28_01720 [Candidatus Uhrbacteria bacterium RIFCSPHIGHO2_12_FULL_57_11]
MIIASLKLTNNRNRFTISPEVAMEDVLTGVYAGRRFVVVNQGRVDEAALKAALSCLEEYLKRLIEHRSIPLRNDVRRGIYTLTGEPLPADAKAIVVTIVERELRGILLCGFSRGDSGVIGYRLDLEELHTLIQ